MYAGFDVVWVLFVRFFFRRGVLFFVCLVCFFFF